MKEEKDTYATTWEYGVVQDGHKECAHCNGYGSSLKDDWNVNTCTVCGGSGLVRDDGLEQAMLDYLRG